MRDVFPLELAPGDAGSAVFLGGTQIRGKYTHPAMIPLMAVALREVAAETCSEQARGWWEAEGRIALRHESCSAVRCLLRKLRSSARTTWLRHAQYR
jgi:hypothetical protein